MRRSTTVNHLTGMFNYTMDRWQMLANRIIRRRHAASRDTVMSNDVVANRPEHSGPTSA